MTESEETASKVLAELLAADRAMANETPGGEHPDAAPDRLVDALRAADTLECAGPMAAVTKIWACLKGGEIAFQEECRLNLTEAMDLLLKYFGPAPLAMAQS